MADLSERSSPAFSHGSLLRVAGTVAKQLLQSPDWERTFPDTGILLGEALRVNHCYVLEQRRQEGGELLLVRRAEWVAPDNELASTYAFSETMAFDGWSYEDWRESASNRQVILDSDPLLAELFKSDPGFSGAGAFALAPIVVMGSFWGFLGVCDNADERSWTSEELDALDLVSDVLASAIERHQMEQERRRVSAVIENSDDAIIGKTPDGIITFWNQSAERLYGYAPSEVIGQSIEIIVPSDRHDELESIMDRLRRGVRIDHHETVRVRKDGRRLAVSVSISPVRSSAGTITGAVTIARDITEKRQAELTLWASEERLRLALDAADVGTWDWSIESGTVVWSGNMERLHGLEPGSFDGTFRDIQRGIHPDDHQMVSDAIERTVNHGHEYHLEYRSIMTDGSVQWRGTRGQVIRDSNGDPIRMVGVCYDITQRKQAELKQRELLSQVQDAHAEADAERARLRELFQHAPAMMALLEGPDHVFTLANDHYLRAVGYRDVIGKPAVDALPEVKEQGLIELLDTAYQTGETVVRAELPVQIDIRDDGTLDQRWFSFAYQPTRGVDGRVTGVLVHAVDMTDQVRARKRVEELALAAAEERDRLQQIIDVLPEGICITDHTGAFLVANEAAIDIWGQPAPEGDYQSYVAFECYYPDGTPMKVDELPLTRSILNGEVVRGQQLTIRNMKNKTLVPALVNSAPLRDSQGALTGAVAVFQDISPLKEFEQQKDEFLQAVSHDLKNPLTTIRGYAQMLPGLPARDPDRFQLAVSNVESASARAIALLDEILDLTRLQMGRSLELTLSEIDLVSLTTHLVEQHQATTSTHEVAVVSSEQQVTGEWDQIRLERVLGNLLTNAITYSPGGGRVEVMVGLDETNEPAHAVIQVRDEGIGIPSRDLPKLFQRFWRGSNVRETFRGTGLGLAGAQAIVEAHGGEISVKSTEGEGSTFTVRLPLRPIVPGRLN